MNTKYKKPKQTVQQLIDKMKFEKGITFIHTSEEDAKYYLTHVNHYFRTAAYRKNYQKYQLGTNKGKYIHLDFAYLQELSTIDMHFRAIVSSMCLDLEHGLKLQLLNDIEQNYTTDGYDIVKDFLSHNPYILKKLGTTNSSAFTHDLIHKYFTVTDSSPTNFNRVRYIITNYSDCPVWVLFELISFGDLINFYAFYYKDSSTRKLSTPVINLIKSLRNGCVHNSCILANLTSGNSHAPTEISRAISAIPAINPNQRHKKLSTRPTLEFTCLLYAYRLIVPESISSLRIKELSYLFFVQIPLKKSFFSQNALLKSNYEYACSLINFFLIR